MSWHGIHQLIARAKAGDADAWWSLHEMVRPYLIDLAQRLLGPAWPHESVSDLTQETWQRVSTKIASFRGGENVEQTGPLFRAWLRQTMKRSHQNQQRANHTQGRRPPPGTVLLSTHPPGDSSDAGGNEPIADESRPSANLYRDERRDRIQRVLDHLSDPMDRELVQAHFFEGRSLRQIAKERGVSDRTLGNRLHLLGFSESMALCYGVIVDGRRLSP